MILPKINTCIFFEIFSKRLCGVFLLGDLDLVHVRKLGISVAKGFIFFFAIKLDTITSSLGYLAFGNFDFVLFFCRGGEKTWCHTI